MSRTFREQLVLALIPALAFEVPRELVECADDIIAVMNEGRPDRAQVERLISVGELLAADQAQHGGKDEVHRCVEALGEWRYEVAAVLGEDPSMYTLSEYSPQAARQVIERWQLLLAAALAE